MNTLKNKGRWIKPVLKYFGILFVFLCAPVFANECVSYKITPKITISAPTWTKEVVQPLEPMNLWHGNVVATMVDNYDIVADITSVEDGFCVGIKQVDAEIGYSNFLVQVDIRHVPNTCSYDAVLAHEDQHIREYLSVIDDFQVGLHNALYSAADSVMPIFVYNSSDIDMAIEEINNKIQSHPEMVIIKQKIKADEEIRNKRIDKNDNGDMLKKCFI
ncbi:MAG: hypothetical protein IJD52_04670 [Alphaproteobacteria bacterium]|nr:hypothetical protein [Alphaproteobacteria bacterium]